MDEELFAKLRESRLVNKSGVTYREFRKTLTPQWSLVWSQIAIAWVMLIVSNSFIFFLSGRHVAIDTLLVVGGSLLIGYIHETAH